MASGVKDHRVILLLGAPRSGTSWLANIMNSHPGVAYSHEPLGKLSLPHLGRITEGLTRRGVLSAEDRRVLVREWARAYPIQRRPPFFVKDFQRTPPWLMKMAWAAWQGFRPTQVLFRLLFSPNQRKPFDVLVKEVGWAVHAGNIVRGLNPELVIITRHPCAVVGSELRGIEKGVMPAKNRDEWLHNLRPAIAELGYSESDVRRLEEFEWLTVCWMVKNRIYLKIAAEHPRSYVVVYEALCGDPVGVSTRLFQFLGWELGTQTLGFLDQSTHEKSSVGTLMRGNQPYFGIYRETAEAADKWKTALPPAQRDRVLDMVRPFFPAYGESDGMPTAAQPTAVQAVSE